LDNGAVTRPRVLLAGLALLGAWALRPADVPSAAAILLTASPLTVTPASGEREPGTLRVPGGDRA
jgi:hypothetical protein